MDQSKNLINGTVSSGESEKTLTNSVLAYPTQETKGSINYFPTTSGDLATWVSALGSILVIVLALFGDAIRNFLFKPSLEIVAGNNIPYFEKSVEKNSSDENGGAKKYLGKIKIKVENKKSTTAESCKIYVDKIFAKKGDGKTYQLIKEFQPSTFLWLGENKNETNSRNIVCGIPNYIEIGKIKLEEQLISSEVSKIETEKYKIYLNIEDSEIEGINIRLNKGTYIVPLTMHAKNLSVPVVKYLYMYWNGNSPESVVTSSDGIEISILSNKEGQKELNTKNKL